jgi:hypothetical protein
MGSKRSRSRHFTHSKPKSTAPKRKSVARKPSRLRTAADAIRDDEHIRTSKTAKQPYISPTQAVREMREGVPATELRHIRNKLEVIQSSAIVVAYALIEQNAEVDDEAARVLRNHVSDALEDQIENIDSLLGDVES